MTEIVVKIPEDLYETIINPDKWLTPKRVNALVGAVIHGKVLSPGHGELKDANILSERKEIMTTIDGEKVFAVRMDDVIGISPIIDADKGDTE